MTIAEDMIDGSCCSLCGCYFEDKFNRGNLFTHGYPVVCRTCHEPGCGYEKAETNTI